MNKKATIKYFLNEDVNPAVYYIEPNKRLSLYPLYVRIFNKSKSTKFRFHPSIHIEKGKDIDDFFDEKKIKHFKVRFESTLNGIMFYEKNLLGNDFTINGFGSRFSFYSQDILQFLIENDNQYIKLKKLTKKHKLDYLLGDISNNPIVQLSLALGILGKDKLIDRFGDFIKKISLFSLVIFYRRSSVLNVYEWLLTNERENYKKFLYELDEQTVANIVDLAESPKNLFRSFGISNEEINRDKEKIDLISRSTHLLTDVFQDIPTTSIDDILDSFTLSIMTEQKKLYKSHKTQEVFIF